MSEPRNWHEKMFLGLHYDIHADACDTELGAALTHEHLREELEKVRPDWVQCDCKGHEGYTSWPTEVGSTSPGVVKDSLRIHRDVTREMGIPLVAHISDLWNNRALELHPDWARINADGSLAGSREGDPPSPCMLSPYAQELLIPLMLEVVDKYDIDGLWMDADNWAVRPCYCNRCTTLFTARTGITNVPRTSADAGWTEWAEFHRGNFEEYVRKYVEPVHARKPSCLVCSNWMYAVNQPDEVGVPVDYLSGDFEHVWGTELSILDGRFLDARGLSWDLMAWSFLTMDDRKDGWTMKPAAQLCQEAASVISLGGAVSLFDQPQRNGHITGWHQDIMAQVAQFVKARQLWCQNTKSVPQVALLHSASHYYRANTDDSLIGTCQSARAPLIGALHALLENHCHVDVLTEPGLIRRINDYKLVVVAEQTIPSEELKGVLRDYAASGGRIILSGVNVASEFGELAGVIPEGTPLEGYFHERTSREAYVYLPVGDEATIVKGPWQPVTLAGASSLINILSEQEPALNDTGIPAVTVNRIGKGCVLAIHNQIFSHYGKTRYPRTRKLVGELLDTLSPEFLVDTDAPARLHIVLRRQQDRLIVHMVNMGTAHPTSPNQGMVEEVPAIGPINLSIKIATRPSRVYLAPSFEGLSWSWCDGTLHARVESVGILDSLVVEE